MDPPEPWETAAPPTAGVESAPPRRPRHSGEIPAGAWEALADAVGPVRPDDLLVVPRGVRHVGDRRSDLVATPPLVLALGREAVGLWTQDRVWSTIPYHALAAVGDARILLYGRLSLLAAHGRLTVRYNAGYRARLVPLIQTLRTRGARCGAPVPALPTVPPPERLPYKWRLLTTGESSRLDLNEPATVLLGRRRPLPGTRIAAAMVVSAREVAVLIEPNLVSRYGIDGCYLPRAGLQQADADGALLRVRVRDVAIQLDVGTELAAAAAHMLATTPHGKAAIHKGL